MRGIVDQHAAQLGDPVVDRPGTDRVVVTPDHLEQPRLGDHLVRVGDQVVEQRERLRGEGDLTAGQPRPAGGPRSVEEGGVEDEADRDLAPGGALVGWVGPLGLLSGIAVGGLVGLFAVMGDLTESLIKREAKAKNSGSLIPGHGGVFDRVDSLLWAAAIAFMVYSVISATR